MNTANAPTAEASSTLRGEIDRLKADLQRLRQELSGLTDDAVHAAKRGATEAKDRVAEGARSAAAMGRDSMEAVEEQVAAGAIASGLLGRRVNQRRLISLRTVAMRAGLAAAPLLVRQFLQGVASRGRRGDHRAPSTSAAGTVPRPESPGR